MRLQLSLLALLLLGGAAEAQTRVSMTTMLYHDSDHTDVISPEVAARAALDDDGGEVTATVAVDIVTSASVDVVTEATPGFTELREEGDLRVSKRVGAWLPGLHYRYSHEADYISHGGGVSAERRLGSADTTLSASLDLIHDLVERHGTPASVFSRTLWTATGQLGLTQVLDRRTVLRAVYTLTFQDGYQAKPYRYVPLFDGAGVAAAAMDGATLTATSFDRYRLPERPPESVPDLRSRHALGLRAIRFLEPIQGSLRLDYRLYYDDWGMWSHTLEAGLRTPLGDKLLGELDSRTYGQTSVWFWQRQYVVPGAGVVPEWRTVDKDLSSSLAETLRARLVWSSGKLTWTGDLAATYTHFFDYMFLDSRTSFVVMLGARYEP